jgi:hypothetical protein
MTTPDDGLGNNVAYTVITVTDKTSPALPAGSNITASVAGTNQIDVSGLQAFTDGRAVDSVTVDCGTSNPGGSSTFDSAADFTTWKNLDTTLENTFTRPSITNDMSISNSTVDSTAYYMFAVAEDTSGNVCDPIATSPVTVTTDDGTVPTGLSNVNFGLGINTSRNIKVDNLSAITDNMDSSPSITVIYNTKNDTSTSEGAVHVVVDSGDDEKITGLDDGVTYCGWVKAIDASSNVAGPVLLGNVTTVDETAPVGTSNVTIALTAGSTSSSIMLADLDQITDNVGVTKYHVFYGQSNDFSSASSNADIDASTYSNAYTVTGLDDGKTHYVWTQAEDAASNVSSEVLLGNLTTVDVTPPTRWFGTAVATTGSPSTRSRSPITHRRSSMPNSFSRPRHSAMPTH